MNQEERLLSVVIPAYNEAETLPEVIRRVRDVPIRTEIIVVDDGSTDGTPEVLEGLAGPDLRVLRQPRNRGKGAAVRAGIPLATGELVVIQDGDLEYDPMDWLPMIRKLDAGDLQVVYGSRILSGSSMSYLRYWLGGRGVTLATNLLYGAGLTDEPTCYKMFVRELIQSIPLEGDGFEFCPEVTARVLRRGITIGEVPISYNPRKIEEGKKISWRDGFIALWVLLKNRFGRVR